jgi:osmotically inducible protein OsmC
MKSKATAIWSGSGKDGAGHLSTGSKVLNNTPYNFKSRFENGTDTNPEELIAAAHAGCFNMKLSFVLGNFGFTPKQLESNCTVDMVDGMVAGSHIELTANVPNITMEKFKECLEDAFRNCPISVLMAENAELSLNYTLIEQ